MLLLVRFARPRTMQNLLGCPEKKKVCSGDDRTHTLSFAIAIWGRKPGGEESLFVGLGFRRQMVSETVPV